MADFTDAKAFWGARYATPDYLFGTRPAAFLEREAGGLAPQSRILLPCDGEGRNSVWLAGQGHTVTAFDITPEGVAKTQRLAGEAGVDVAAHVASVTEWDWRAEFDAVIAIFVQFAGPEMRARMFADFASAVRPGGLLMLHGYAPRQIEYGTGGPPHRENLYTKALLARAFDGWDILRLEDYDAEVDEGRGHSGLSALVDLVARKPV